MEITIKDIQNNLKTLPEDLFQSVNDYIDFLKAKYNRKEKEAFTLSENQKKILDSQEDLDDNNYQDSDEFLAELKKEYGL